MHTVASPDGSTIAYDRYGNGPVVILVNGALGDRKLDQRFKLMSGLALLLAPGYTVINYDRRGRGDSTEAGPFAVEREIEDIAALIAALGGSASLFGFSSGGALALRAAGAGIGIDRVAVYEPPLMVDRTEWRPPADYGRHVDELLAVTMPALVVHGAKSPAGLQKGSRALAAVLPDARLEVLPGVSHRPKVKVLAPGLAGFLAGDGGTDPRGNGFTTAAA